MRELDRRTIEEFGTHGDLLMERAGQGVADIALDLLATRMGRSILLIAGIGNNGGDVFAAATVLAASELDITVWICGSKQKIKGDAEYHLKKMIRTGIIPKEISSPNDLYLEWPACVIVDGLLGTGAKGAPRGLMNDVIDFINAEAHRSFILSIDIPTGIDADTGIAAGHAVRANLTATMGLPKTGLIRPEALPNSGNIAVIDIGIPRDFQNQVQGCRDAELIDRSDLLIPARANDSHKGTYGHLLLIGGSIGYTGSICMAARAALRSGAGLVSILTPEAVYPIVASSAGPEVMVHPVPDLEKIPDLFSTHWNHVDTVLIGPGFPQKPELIEQLLAACTVPIVLDAGALCVEPESIARANVPVIITPHPGEFERMFGQPVTDRWAQAQAASDLLKQTVVLKGAGTVVAHPDHKPGINMTGNPGMATGGSGDVLAGIIAAFLGREMSPFTAATTGVYLHGLAGDIAASGLTQESLVATDIIEALPDAFRILQAG